MHGRVSIIKRLTIYLVRYHFAVLLALIGALLALEAFFLYRYFWQALTESKIVYELKQRAAFEELQMETHQKIKTFQEKKQIAPAIDWDALKDPFVAQD